MFAIDYVVEILRSQFSGGLSSGAIGAATLAELSMRGCSLPRSPLDYFANIS